MKFNIITTITLLLSLVFVTGSLNDIAYDENDHLVSQGLIVILQPKTEALNEWPQGLSQLVLDYKSFVENTLKNKVKYTYDKVFYGFSMELNNLDGIYQALQKHYSVDSPQFFENVAGFDFNLVQEGVREVLEDYKKNELEVLGVELVVSPDSIVETKRETR